MDSSKTCPCCGASISYDATECKYCGEKVAVAPLQPQPDNYPPPQQGYPQQYQQGYAQPAAIPSNKNKTAAGLLAIFLGGLGVHKFYLGQTGLGIVYLLFCWTYIPAIIGLIEGIIYLSSSDEVFYQKYVKK